MMSGMSDGDGGRNETGWATKGGGMEYVMSDGMGGARLTWWATGGMAEGDGGRATSGMAFEFQDNGQGFLEYLK